MRRRLAVWSLGVLALLSVTAAAVVWVRERVDQRRAARIVELDRILADVRTHDTLDAAQGCLVLEQHLLTRSRSRALSTTCDAPVIERRGPRSALIRGLVWTSEYQGALLGGGHGESFCLARGAKGWDVVGDDWALPDCRFDVDADAPDLAASAALQVADHRRATALAALAVVENALASTAPVPTVCADLPDVTGKALGMVDTDMLSRPPAEAAAVGFLGFTSGPFRACTDPTWRLSTCELFEPWSWVLAFDHPEKTPPVKTGTDTFTGGGYRAELRVIDMVAGEVRCARPLRFHLGDEVLLIKSQSLQAEYEEGLRQVVCAGVRDVSAGRIVMDVDSAPNPPPFGE